MNFRIIVTNVNDPPQIVTSLPGAVAENVEILETKNTNSVVVTLGIIDPDINATPPDTLTVSLTGV